MPVTFARYVRNVTIKQLLIGTVLGSSIVGLMVHRMHQSKQIIQHKDHSHKIASLKKRRHAESHSEAELSTRKLYGR